MSRFGSGDAEVTLISVTAEAMNVTLHEIFLVKEAALLCTKHYSERASSLKDSVSLMFLISHVYTYQCFLWGREWIWFNRTLSTC